MVVKEDIFSEFVMEFRYISFSSATSLKEGGCSLAPPTDEPAPLTGEATGPLGWYGGDTAGGGGTWWEEKESRRGARFLYSSSGLASDGVGDCCARHDRVRAGKSNL